MYIGIDLGGTNIACGLVDESGRIIYKSAIKTGRERDFSEIARDTAALCERVANDAGYAITDIKAVGIGSPGSVDSEHGIIRFSPNIKMENTPVTDILSELLHMPVALENDANAAALGEYIAAGGSASSFILVTLGTGVGGGIILGGKIWRGFNGSGAEIGHTVIVKDGELCGCGVRGCWEAYASVSALIRQTKAAIAAHPESLMCAGTHVTGMTSFDAARRGDKAAAEVVTKYCEYVGVGIGNMINIFQPESIAIGGGISREGEYLLAPVREYAYRNDYNHTSEKTRIYAAALGNDAGIVGAAMAAKTNN